jgi:hypothetical protein
VEELKKSRENEPKELLSHFLVQGRLDEMSKHPDVRTFDAT